MSTFNKKEYNKQWYAEHRQEQLKYKKAKLREKLTDNPNYHKEYWEKVKDKKNAARRERYATDPEYAEKKRQWKKEWNKTHKESKKNGALKLNYGITLEEYNLLFVQQDGKCAICGTHQSKQKRTMAVDHNHETGEVRGLLCDNCNLLLGHAHDNAELLRSALEYLQGGV